MVRQNQGASGFEGKQETRS